MEPLENRVFNIDNSIKEIKAMIELQNQKQPETISQADLKNAERLIRDLKSTMTRKFEILKAEMDAGFIKVDP